MIIIWTRSANDRAALLITTSVCSPIPSVVFMQSSCVFIYSAELLHPPLILGCFDAKHLLLSRQERWDATMICINKVKILLPVQVKIFYYVYSPVLHWIFQFFMDGCLLNLKHTLLMPFTFTFTHQMYKVSMLNMILLAHGNFPMSGSMMLSNFKNCWHVLMYASLSKGYCLWMLCLTGLAAVKCV